MVPVVNWSEVWTVITVMVVFLLPVMVLLVMILTEKDLVSPSILEPSRGIPQTDSDWMQNK